MGDNGISAYVALIDDAEPSAANQLSCALGGNGVLSTFLQESPFYSGRDMAILTPKYNFTKQQLLYYCACILANRYRYSYGRQANRTLKNLIVPSLDEIPDYVEKANISQFDTALNSVENGPIPALNTETWREYKLTQLFNMKAGKYIDKLNYEPGDTPYISASDNNNGQMGSINIAPVFRGNSITIGKVAATTYYQPSDFCATSDVTILEPLFKLNRYIGLFLCAVISQEKFKWSYGRQIRLNDCKNLRVKLPSKIDGFPDFDFMENYIKTLPYSSQI